MGINRTVWKENGKSCTQVEETFDTPSSSQTLHSTFYASNTQNWSLFSIRGFSSGMTGRVFFFFWQKTNTSRQSTAKVKAGLLWPKTKDELTKQLQELKTELGQLRIQKITSSGSKLNKMCVAASGPPSAVLSASTSCFVAL